MEPVVMALKEEYSGQAEFIVVNLDHRESEKLVEKHEVLYIPAFYFINSQGKIVAEEAGALNYEEMAARMEAMVGDTDLGEELNGLDYFFSEVLPGTVEQRSLFTLALVFAGGVLTSFSPCILSMVPLLVSYIGGYSEGPKSRGFFLSFSFVVGLAVTFAILGFIAAGFGQVFGEVGQFWYYLLAGVAIVMGLQLIGVFSFTLPGLKTIPYKKFGLGGSLIMGMLFGLVASPCATPVLAVIITYAAVQAEPFYGSSLLFIYGIGHGLPLLAAGTFTGIAKSLPKINKYTYYLSYASGLVLIILGLILLAWVGWR
ncbi:MAG: cytochrome c biogenesis protein CcdA [Bacillota bacterium]